MGALSCAMYFGMEPNLCGNIFGGIGNGFNGTFEY
jgi:hypothetical protein